MGCFLNHLYEGNYCNSAQALDKAPLPELSLDTRFRVCINSLPPLGCYCFTMSALSPWIWGFHGFFGLQLFVFSYLWLLLTRIAIGSWMKRESVLNIIHATKINSLLLHIFVYSLEKSVKVFHGLSILYCNYLIQTLCWNHHICLLLCFQATITDLDPCCQLIEVMISGIMLFGEEDFGK